ncbi:hypothetical protein [Aliarcobacter butzleri]|uniref:Uncharacterized protein n=1 Tax=Aliarcobacter butzleri TaxID=28197 RepID=A0AAW7PRT9_9BACT|nr:hypothetical protein [Aliarcobacter butzleri]MDN5063922.1 hypothetical protein [Aliarcobacter butzleri]MDN5065156.1 hypothetical protein [Aliarcobacter butzleri]
MQTIHDVVVDTLNYFGKPTDISLIYEHITKNELYSFGAKKEDPQHIVKNLIERKCINSNASYKTKQLLFYKEGTKKYGLLEWLEESDKVEILESFHKAQFQNIESKLDEVESKLGIEKINELVNQNILKIDEHAKKQSELLKEQLTNNFHNNTLKIENLIASFRLETEKIKKDFDVETLNKENEIDKKINDISKQFEEEIFSLKKKVNDNLSEEYAKIKELREELEKNIYMKEVHDMSEHFSNKADTMEKEKEKYYKKFEIGIIVTFVISIFVVLLEYIPYLNELHNSRNIFVTKLTLLLPILLFVTFMWRNYLHSKKLFEEYSYKSILAKHIPINRRILKNDAGLDDKEIAQYSTLKSVEKILANPNENQIKEDTTAIDKLIDRIQELLQYKKQES